MLTVLWVCRPHGLREKRRGYKHSRISGLLWVQTLLGTRYSRRWKIKIWKKRRACRITQGAGSLPCALRVTASQNVRPHIRLRFDFLFVLTIEIASYSQNPGRFALKRTSGIAAKPAGLNTAEDQMSTYRPVDSASVMRYQGRWLTGRQYPIAMSRLRTPADGSLGAALHGRSRFHRKPRNVIIPNWHSTQSWHKPVAVAGL